MKSKLCPSKVIEDEKLVDRIQINWKNNKNENSEEVA